MINYNRLENIYSPKGRLVGDLLPQSLEALRYEENDRTSL